MNTTNLLTLAALLSLAACKGEKAGSEGAPEAKTSVDVAAVNAAVPEALAPKITFEQAKLDDDRIIAAVPSTWESKHIPGRYTPARDADLGFFTSFGVGSNCDGSCADKDWKATADKVEFEQFTSKDGVVKDEALDGGRFLKAKDGESVHLVFAWWKKGASRYFFCRATLEGAEALSAEPAFDKACRSLVIAKWN